MSTQIGLFFNYNVLDTRDFVTLAGGGAFFTFFLTEIMPRTVYHSVAVKLINDLAIVKNY